MDKTEAHSLTIFPMDQSMELTPGNTYTGSIMVVNPANSSTDLHYAVAVERYNAVNVESDESSKAFYSQIIDWITIPEPKGVLAPNESRKVEYTITVPEDAAGGGQYAVIEFSTDPEEEGTGTLQIRNQFSIGSIIYAYIDGEILRGGEIVENTFPSFALQTPVSATARLTNDGNIHETAIIQLSIKNAITGEEIFPTTDQQRLGWTEVVMPGSTQVVTRDLEGLPAVGIVSVEQTVRFEGQVSSTTHNIIICPIWFILLVVAIIAAIIGGIVGFVHYRRKHRVVL